ncbi:MAG TPA: M48 family metallopeptidase [Allosphingosinicella sp.]|jgi:hypothetical protein
MATLPANGPGARASQVTALAPATASAAAGSTLRAADSRVAAVGYRLALSGIESCPERQPLTGLLFHHLAEYLPADRATMITRHALDRGPGILTVLAGTPAAQAGLQAGDVLLAINGARLPTGTALAAGDPDGWRKRAEAIELRLTDALMPGPARLKMLRSGREFDTVLTSVNGCPGRVRLARSKQVNAFANGRTVTVTSAMLNFLKSDDELAVVLGHELSHNILKHPDLLDEQGVPKKGILRAIGKNASRVWKTEEEADRLAVRLVWAAGYDVEAIIPFWRRYLGRYDALPQIFRTHPSIGVRERLTREEIAALPKERRRS